MHEVLGIDGGRSSFGSVGEKERSLLVLFLVSSESVVRYRKALEEGLAGQPTALVICHLAVVGGSFLLIEVGKNVVAISSLFGVTKGTYIALIRWGPTFVTSAVVVEMFGMYEVGYFFVVERSEGLKVRDRTRKVLLLDGGSVP